MPPLNGADDLSRNYRGFLVARVTSVRTPNSGPLSGRPVYEWTEQSLSATGGNEDAVPPRKGVYTSPTVFDNVLLDANDADLAVGQYVLARMKGAVGGATVYESVTTAASGSGGDGPCDCPPRCTGTVYSVTRYRSARDGDHLIQYSWLETLAYTAAGCLELTTGEESSEDLGCVDCPDGPPGSGSDDTGSTPGTFPGCGAAAATLTYVTTSDIPCLDGLANDLAFDGIRTWTDGNSISPCGTDAGLAVYCDLDAWTASYDGVGLTLVDQTDTSLTFEGTFDGSGTVPAGTATFVVTIP